MLKMELTAIGRAGDGKSGTFSYYVVLFRREKSWAGKTHAYLYVDARVSYNEAEDYNQTYMLPTADYSFVPTIGKSPH